MKEDNQWMYPIIGAGTGLLLAILFLTLGFFKTLLVLVLVGLGAFIGYFVQKAGIVEYLIRK
ncbi:DUF2273 domain-containing protein [Streptococcus suis]|uniref:DUF2273 domain-containing protein n=2 Tax=Streptococcus TaxID=1301 RepID=A0A6L8N011_STRSU|nr:DUF2273 domain-containing protein [Streptococcus parasuis]MYN70593.1 DUF2273 domain-containing protein [Streptococcus suis]MDG4478877.1 DUF2273 domain-containing protein [Streptococcus parasuis]NQK94023.1 DUF2273 domain-containing protein [Streptococcus suis]NQM30428.1 DUF2273 domain-containing protein [Streptococcus suis]NQM55821.1 DUF2273 domain-containing protein [Streptococcus suis]